MRQHGEISFAQVLTEWARHEFEGRHREILPAEAYTQGPESRMYTATQLLMRMRQNVIPAILAAGVLKTLRVTVDPEDMPRLFVMGQDPVTNWSRNKLAEVSPSADYVRGQADASRHVTGAMIAIARHWDEGPVTFFDGMHRLAAWVVHVQRGFAYPLSEVYLIETSMPAPAFELPERAEAAR